jgi:hypothetical protein
MANTDGSTQRHGSDDLGTGGPLAIVVFSLVLLSAALISLIPPTSEQRIWQADQVLLTDADDPLFASPGRDLPGWEAVDVKSLGAVERVLWLRTTIELAIGESIPPPYALFLSGPFSAEVYWDGELLGRKGRPAQTMEMELPGPIDSVLYVPAELAAPGNHTLALRISAHHVGYELEVLFHALSLRHFESDARRALRYYTLPLLLSGGLLLLCLQFARIAISSGNLSAVWLAITSACLLMQLLSEVSRSLVDYAYHWHVWRSVSIWLFAVATLLTLNLHAYLRSSRGRPESMALLIAVPVALLASFFAHGFDDKTVTAVAVLCLPTLLLTLRSIGNVAESSVTHFLIKQAGREEPIDANQVVLISADGNYTELLCEDGQTRLHQLRLGQLMREVPASFFRIHRSHAVNLDKVVQLKSMPGSRYRVELAGGASAPVSRYQVKGLRQLLQGRGC